MRRLGLLLLILYLYGLPRLTRYTMEKLWVWCIEFLIRRTLVGLRLFESYAEAESTVKCESDRLGPTPRPWPCIRALCSG